MLIDCHVHVAAFTPGNGSLSPRVLKSPSFRFMRWKFHLAGSDGGTEQELALRLVSTIGGAEQLDAAVVLALDAVFDSAGRRDPANTHLYVTNDYVIRLAAKHPKVLFGASVHPFRKDAVAELERCIQAGAVLLKWLPVTQNFSPADPRCFPIYEALAHHKLPLLSHTGGEQALPNLDRAAADPSLLTPALERGVTVIAAHCGTSSSPADTDYLPTFMRMVRDHERFYGDTSALCLPTRSYAFHKLLADKFVRTKLVHGSDWPIIPIPPVSELGLWGALKLFKEDNWLRRDILAKRQMGFDDAYWSRAATLLRLPPKKGSQGVSR